MPTLYAIVLKSTGEIITPENVRAVWPSYGYSSYKVSKKLYDSMGKAKCGFAYLPTQLMPLLQIQEFKAGGTVFDGQSLMEEYKTKKEKRTTAKEKAKITRQMRERELEMKVLESRLAKLKGQK